MFLFATGQSWNQDAAARVSGGEAGPVMRTIFGFVAFCVAVCTAAPALGQQSERQTGEALLVKNCSGCHAIGRFGASPHRQAPPFRTLSRRYPVEALEEALGEGLSSGHPDMPDFVFPPQQINGIVAYLRSIQDR
jgi:cytochrome c